MGIFGKIKSMGEDFKYAMEDLHENVSTNLQNLGEITTDGFKEMVIKGNTDYKTSLEKREEADWIIYNAKQSLEDASKKLEEYYFVTDGLVKEHYQFKQSLNDRFLDKKRELINRFIIHIDEERSNLDSFSFKNISGIAAGVGLLRNAGGVAGASMAMNGLSLFSRINPLMTGLSVAVWFWEKNRRVAAANEYLDNAKVFQNKVNVKISELKSIKSSLTLIRKKIKEERGLMDRLLARLEVITAGLSVILKKSKPTEEELEKAEASIMIWKAIDQALTTEFITEAGAISPVYNEMLKSLKQVEAYITERGI